MFMATSPSTFASAPFAPPASAAPASALVELVTVHIIGNAVIQDYAPCKAELSRLSKLSLSEHVSLLMNIRVSLYD